MERLGKFLCLTSSDRRLLVRGAFLLGAIRLGLSVLPFWTVRGLLARVVRKPIWVRKANQTSSDRIAWAVMIASRYVPKATCLAQALAAQVLLARGGHPSTLHIGVAKGEEARLETHARLESEGKIVIGGSELGRYTPLASFEGKSL